MRTKMVDGHPVPLTPEENAQRDAEEAAWASQAPQREADRLDRESVSMSARLMRELVIAALPEGHPKRKQAEAAEKAVQALGIRKQ